MWPDEAQLVLRKSNTFQTIHSIVGANQHEDENSDTDTLGGIIFDGKLGWIANGASLEVITIDSGNKLAVFDFDRLLGTNDSYISCISEIHIPGVKSCCLAVGLQLTPNGGKICLISIQGSCVLGMIDFFDKVTTCHFVPKRQSDHSLRSLLRCFDGCLAVGTDQGKVILLDMCFKRCKFVIDEMISSEDNLETQQCHIIFANADPEEIMEHHEQSKQDDIYFGIQLEVLENARHVQSIVVIPFSMTLVVGLDDGRMVLYDLENLQAFHLAYPPEKSAPLLYLSYLEPADDPRACIYVWALHASKNGGIGVMHSIMFQHKYIDRTETVYRNFLSCSPRLTMPMYEKSSCPVACHSITKLIDEEEEQQVTLCAIVWLTKTGGTLMVFDLNQWYKEQMPEVGDWRRFPSYTATFPMGELCPLALCLDQDMIQPFNSIQRPEEHFFPNSLSFDVSILTKNTIMRASWPGLQKLMLDNLVKAASKAILDPNKFVKEMINAALVPQFQDFNVNLPMGIDLKREYLLTIALEYNCVTFLKKVAVAIADGSHIGNVPTEALGLSTVTDWIWNRARSLKDTSNNYSVPLFDYSGRTIDCGMQKSLTLCTRQLRIVANLMELICTECQQFIPEHVHKILLDQLQSIQLASDYQEAIQWLLNVGLLPEGVWRSDSHVSSQPDEPIFVPYPYHLVNSYYSTQRMKLSLEQNRSGEPSPFIYIDMFIEYCCDMQAITDLWKEQGGSGLYPPTSLQNMLRVLLIPEIPIEAKQILFVYLFMDINHVLSDGRYAPVVQNLIKFPAVFKMDPATIKVTQSFWYLDHGDLDTAIEELISPLSQSHTLKQWQRDFLITTLLKQDSPHLALRILKAPGVPAKPSLELKTLLSNNLVSEAFKFQRAKGDKNLLMQFFEGTMQIQKRDLLLDLSLNEEESKTLIEFLGKANVSLTENLHFVYLLQRSDFVDAVSLVDKLMKSSQRDRNYDLNVPREILTIYHTTLEPTSRQLTYLAYSNPEKFQLKKFKEIPKPLSSSLIRQRLDPTAGIYQRSILSVKEAGSREMFEDDEKNERSLPFLRRSGLGTFSFVQKTQSNNVVYPEIVNRKQEKKRQLEDKDKNDIEFNEYEGPRKRRRLDESEVPRKSLKDYDMSVLARFNPKTKPKFNFTEGNDSIYFGQAANERTPEKLEPNKSLSPSTLLRTPHVEKAISPDKNRFTPQSILKSASHASLPRSTTPLSYVSRKSFESEDQKSIRFAIPGSSSVDTSFNSSVLQLSSQTLDTTKDKTIDESIVSKDEFFSPNTSMAQDQTIKESIEDAIHVLEEPLQVEKKDTTTNQECLNISEGHEDLSFLADAPQPRPPIRSSSRSSHGSGSSPRSTRSSSRSVSPSIVTRSKSIDYDVDEKLSETPEPNISLENASTPIASLTAKRSQRSLGRAVLEKNLKQSLMTDIFGEYSKTGQSLEENPNTSTLSETDTSDVGFLSYEQSGILTGDTLVDQQILKKMIGHETIGDPTMGDSTLRLLNDSSNILSDSSNYEDSKDEISATEAKLVSVDQLQEMLEDEPEPESMETETTEPLVEVAPKNDEQKTLEAISIGDSEESYLEDTEEDDDDDDDDESDKFANKSDDSEDQPLDQHRERTPDDLDDTEEYYEEEQSSLSHDTSYGETASEPSTPGKAPDNEEVISIGSTSDEEDETADEKQLQQFTVQTEPEVPVFVPQEIPTYYNDPPSLNQGLIMSHMEAAHDIPETYAASQSLLYLDVAQNEFHQPQSQMNEVQMSELLYGEVETDTDSLNLAIVEEESRSQEMQPEITEQEVPVQEVVVEEEPVVVEEEKPKNVVKSKVIETKKSEVANARVDFIKEVYDETVVQEVPEEEEDEEEEESHVDAPEVVVETEPEQEVVEEEIVVDDDVVEEEVVTTENDEAEIDEPLQVDEVESENQPENQPQEMSTEQSEEKEIQTWLVNAGVVEPQSSEVEKEVVEEEIVVEEIVEEEPAEKSMEPEELVQEDNSDENESELVIDEPTSSHEEEVHQEVHESPNTSTEAEKETDEPTSTLQEAEQEAANTSTEPEISVEEPTSSTENQPMAEEETTPVKIDTRKSVYAEDPLDKTSLLPIVDDGIPEDVLNRSNINEAAPETLVQKLRTRAQSVDPKPTALDSPVIKRNLRATSVPKSNEPLTPRKIRRISVDTQLEQIEEGTPLDVPSTPKRRSTVVVSTSGTPSMLTRSASRRLSTDVAPEPTTPSRNTRGASKERQRVAARRITDKAEEIDEEPVTTRTRTRKASTTEDADDNKSEISVKSTRSLRRAVSAGTSRSRLTSVSSSTDTSPVYEDGSASETYSQSRRLTRRQKQMMEKLSQTSSTSFATTMASNDNQSEISDSESVAESTKSTISNVSKKSTASKRGKTVTKSISAPAKRSTRSNSKPDQEPEEIGTRKRKATKPVHLETIPEDDKPSNKSTASEEESHEEAPAEVPVKRTRKARK